MTELIGRVCLQAAYDLKTTAHSRELLRMRYGDDYDQDEYMRSSGQTESWMHKVWMCDRGDV